MATFQLNAKKIETAKSLATSFTTDPINTNTIDVISFIVSTASVTDNTGTFYIQQRIYENENQKSEWATITLAVTPTLANANQVFKVAVSDLTPGQIRLGFTADGGTPNGNCDIWISGKANGGK